jgi:glycosyltransferase involved in cell wall biosynthesis
VSLSVVVPVYNSERSLPALVERLRPVLEKVASDYELILVNDGSGDGSWQVIQGMVSSHAWIQGIDLTRNYGQHNALLCGIRAARFPVTITMDDDMQNPPEEIPRLLDRLGDGVDVVYGRAAHGAHGMVRNLASFITKLTLQNAMGAATARQVSAFRAFRTQLRDAFSGYRGPHVSIDVLLTWGTNRFTSIPVRCDPRTVGTSNYTLTKLVAHALNMMTGFTTLPLQAASLLGFFCTLLGAGLLVYVLAIRLIYGGVVHWFPFLASVITIFSGAQLFALGVFGEYLGRIHFRLMDRPTYTIHGTARGESVAGSAR